MTPQQQAEVQNMMNIAFEARMKKEPFPNDNATFIKGYFNKVLTNFGFNTINIRSSDLTEILMKEKDFTYFETGTMLNCIMSASFEKNGLKEEVEIVEFIATIEPIQDVYNKFVAQCRKAAQSEVKTKLKLANNPIANYIQ